MHNDGSDSSVLSRLCRKKDRAGDRALLYEVLDSCLIGVVSTVLNGEPWSVPMLIGRDGNRVLLHGSTGAGALSHISSGAPVALSATIIDGITVSERQFTHSANYRSVVLRGKCSIVPRENMRRALDIFTDSIIPGRSAECPEHSVKEVSQTILLQLLITEDNWIAKMRSGPPSGGENGWTGVIPIQTSYGFPTQRSGDDIPESVLRMIENRARPEDPF
ncbi:pyridoxamine 5'-phosphate oxidase family protein [Mycobacteroides abscessus]|uniref:pyridoxamine 5'-phosphate oxidase family protein n=1 Tax=Mycobacteroides abscessus TaxID=36809 RepID=UPI00210647DC|nr:pyridoxamine 5'-phosphate oxidase family protein [Mycobacteroides abscessus]